MNNAIGIIDSGVGGLSIWKEITSRLPHEPTLYIADSKYCPYGERSPEEIYFLAKRLVDYLISHDIKLLVLACNTITVHCLDTLRQDFPQIPIIGTVPVIKTAAEKSLNKKIGVLSTEKTATSDYQAELIHTFAPDCEVINIGTNRLVPYVEKGIIEGEEIEAVVREVLTPFVTAHVDVLALGCTHFPFLKNVMQKVLGETVLLLDSAEAIARQVETVLTKEQKLTQSEATHQLYTTATKEEFAIVIPKLLLEERNKISNISSLTI